MMRTSGGLSGEMRLISHMFTIFCWNLHLFSLEVYCVDTICQVLTFTNLIAINIYICNTTADNILLSNVEN